MWVWFNVDPDKLPAKLSNAFGEEDSSFGISTVSVWEAMVAIERGRITSAASPESTVRAWIGANPFHVVDLNLEVAILSRTLAFDHDDPADRFIAATAYHLACPLATADDRLRRLPWLNLFS